MPFSCKLVRNRRAATAIEYWPHRALVAVAGIAAASNLGTGVSTTFNNASTAMDG